MNDNDYGISDERLWYRIAKFQQRYPGTLTADDLKEVIRKSGRECCWCEKKNLFGRDLTFEHLGHTNDPNTLAVACYSCNSSHNAGVKKHSDLPADVRRHREATKHRTWEKENREAVRAAKRADYQKSKDTTRKRYLEVKREFILAEKKRYREEKKAKIAAYQKEWDAANKERHAEQRKQWREQHGGEVKRRWDDYAADHREELNAKARARNQANRDQILVKKRAAYEANRELRRAEARAYHAAHRDELNAKKREKRLALRAATA